MEKSLEQLKQEYEKNHCPAGTGKTENAAFEKPAGVSGKRFPETEDAPADYPWGSLVESIAPQTKELTETEFYSLMESILNLPQAEHFIRSAAENHARISGQEKGGD